LTAELQVLKKCLAPDGIGIKNAKKLYGRGAFQQEYQRRESQGLPPMADIDGQCYGSRVQGAPRKQWVELARAQPHKFLNVPNLHLSQAMIGRSLYVYPLEWWYALFPKQDLYFLCTEEMRDVSGEPVNKLGRFLGLPSYNFSSIISEGMYNVGGHKGYDKVTSWEEVAKEHGDENETLTIDQYQEEIKEDVPLSEEFRKEILEFFKPHNERLFELVGRRCSWDE